jgi:lysophospholipase L1-like esterase
MPHVRDLRSEPFRIMVALGESHVAGMSASEERFRWVNVVADLLSEFQGVPVQLYNKGISANAISPRSPGYATSAKPSALERYQRDVIALRPDLFLLSYGLNDMRAGMHPEDFRQDMQRIISDVQQACQPVIVLTTVYYMTRYDLYPPYDRGSPEATRIYNEVIRQLAQANGCLLADIYEAEGGALDGGAPWVMHPDTVHANDLGHRLIGHRVFEVIATHCSGVAARVTKALERDRAEVEATMAMRREPQNYDLSAP